MTYAGKDGIEIVCELVCLEPDRPDVATITAKVNGEAVGWATTEIAGRRDARGRPKGFSVMDVWVKEDECSKGIARAMYDHADHSGFGPLYPVISRTPERDFGTRSSENGFRWADGKSR